MVATEYPIFPKTTTPATEAALLHNCTKERMLAIAKDLFGLTGLSRLNKDVIFKAVFDHMLGITECVQCEGQCRPVVHEFPPYTATTPVSTPSPTRTSPPPGRGDPIVSPTSGLIRHDISRNTEHPGTSSQLYQGQPGQGGTTQQAVSLQQTIRNGAQLFTEPDRDALAADQARNQAVIDKAEAEEDARRKRLLEEAAADSEEITLDDLITASRKKQQEEADAKHAAKEAEFNRQLDEVRRQKRISRAAPRQPVVPPRGPASVPPAPRLTDSGSAPPPGAPALPANEVFEISDSGTLPIKNLVDYMSQSLITALDHRDRSKSCSVPLGAADVHNVNAVPSHPNTGRMALRAVANKEMCDRLGLAPPPNMVVEGDPTNLDYQKVSKYMKSGSRRANGEFVERQTTWPEECLAPSAPSAASPAHDKLSFVELMDGFLGKILTETPSGNLDIVVANKLSYLKELAVMHYTLDLSNVLAVNRRFLEGWENKNFEWTDWSRIEAFLRETKFQQLVSSMARGRDQQFRNGNGRSNSAPPGPPKPSGHINGVSIQFHKDNNICMKFNKSAKSCTETSNPHKHPHESNRMLYHVCAACKKAGKSGDGHGSHDASCNNKQSFRQ